MVTELHVVAAISVLKAQSPVPRISGQLIITIDCGGLTTGSRTESISFSL